jgi:hypothetical protein
MVARYSRAPSSSSSASRTDARVPRIAGQMRRPAQRYVPIGKQVRLGMTIALRSLCSTTVDMGSGCGEAGAEGRGASSVDWS